jgi:hypothetical protein
MMRKLILAFVVTIMAATLAAADTITLRDGRTVRGQVLGFVSGRFAVRLTANLDPPATMQTEQQSNRNGMFTGSGEAGDVIFIHPRSIQRIDIDGRNLADARFVMRNVRVELGANWVDTGLDLQRGETVRIRANGTIIAGDRRITPAGTGATDPYAPLPRASEGALIGVIGDDPNSPIFEIGAEREFTTEREGRLYLTSNRNSFADARGAFNARVFRDIRVVQQAAGNRNDDFDDIFEGGTTGQTGRVRRRDRPGTGGGGQTQPPLPSGPQEWTVSVPGNSRGVDTSIDVRTGDILNVTATGSIVAGRRAGEVSPDGGRTGFGGLLGTRPVPSAGVGALIGYIRLTNGQATQPFIVGSQQSITSPVDGRLFLLVNDDDYSDNSGNFTAKIVRSGSQAGGGSTQGGGERTVTVYADSRDTDTGVEVRAGQRVTFSANGTIYSRNATTTGISPEGYRRVGSPGGVYPVRDASFGALVGYVRTADGRASQPFYIGSQRTIDAPQSGRLFLLVNDDDYRDNSGSFQVRINY